MDFQHGVSCQGVLLAVVGSLGERCWVLWARCRLWSGAIAAMRKRSFAVCEEENAGVCFVIFARTVWDLPDTDVGIFYLCWFFVRFCLEEFQHRISRQGVLPAVVGSLGERCGVLWRDVDWSDAIAAMRKRSFAVCEKGEMLVFVFVTFRHHSFGLARHWRRDSKCRLW